jgi:hypothetical protein
VEPGLLTVIPNPANVARIETMVDEPVEELEFAGARSRIGPLVGHRGRHEIREGQ